MTSFVNKRVTKCSNFDVTFIADFLRHNQMSISPVLSENGSYIKTLYQSYNAQYIHVITKLRKHIRASLPFFVFVFQTLKLAFQTFSFEIRVLNLAFPTFFFVFPTFSRFSNFKVSFSKFILGINNIKIGYSNYFLGISNLFSR